MPDLDNDEIHAIIKFHAAAIELIDSAELEIRHAADALINLASSQAPDEKQLDINWLGQNAGDDSDDGGPACLAMWLNYLGHDLTTDNVVRATGLGKGFRYTTPYNLIAAAKMYDLTLRRVARLDLPHIYREIDEGRPVAVLLHYSSLKKHWDETGNAARWVLVTGYNAKVIYYNDPRAPDDHGKAISLDFAAFEKAMLDATLDGNTPRQGLIAA